MQAQINGENAAEKYKKKKKTITSKGRKNNVERTKNI